MAKILKFELKKDDEEDRRGLIRRIRKFLSLKDERKVTKLIPKDVRSRFERMPFIDGKEISNFREFLSYIAKKSGDKNDELYEYYNKLEIRWLDKEDYESFQALFSDDLDWDIYLAYLLKYENTAVNQLRTATFNKDPLNISKYNTKVYFSKLLLCLFDERINSINT